MLQANIYFVGKYLLYTNPLMKMSYRLKADSIGNLLKIKIYN